MAGVKGDAGMGKGRFVTEDVGEDAADEEGVHRALEGAGDRGVGTTSG